MTKKRTNLLPVEGLEVLEDEIHIRTGTGQGPVIHVVGGHQNGLIESRLIYEVSWECLVSFGLGDFPD